MEQLDLFKELTTANSFDAKFGIGSSNITYVSQLFLDQLKAVMDWRIGPKSGAAISKGVMTVFVIVACVGLCMLSYTHQKAVVTVVSVNGPDIWSTFTDGDADAGVGLISLVFLLQIAVQTVQLQHHSKAGANWCCTTYSYVTIDENRKQAPDINKWHT